MSLSVRISAFTCFSSSCASAFFSCNSLVSVSRTSFFFFQVPIILHGGGVPCFRTPYPTLQSVFRHHPCVIVVVGDQGLTVEQVIGTQTDGICFLAVLALTVRLLFLGFAPFTRHDGNNGCVDVRSLLVHVQMCGNHIVFAECGLQPLDAVVAPFIEFSFFPVCSSCPRAYPTRPPERHGLGRV